MSMKKDWKIAYLSECKRREKAEAELAAAREDNDRLRLALHDQVESRKNALAELAAEKEKPL